MKFSSKILKCQLSPVRKFNPCADQAVAAGRTIYHLNIGQPDVKTPESFYQAVREFREPTLEYAPASGLPAYIDAVRGYYAKLGVKLEREDILATSGGGEALESSWPVSWTMAMSCWCQSPSTPTTIPSRL